MARIQITFNELREKFLSNEISLIYLYHPDIHIMNPWILVDTGWFIPTFENYPELLIYLELDSAFVMI